MKTNNLWYQILKQLGKYPVFLFLASSILPLLIAATYAFVLAWQYDHLPSLSMWFFGSSLVLFLPALWIQYRETRAQSKEDSSMAHSSEAPLSGALDLDKLEQSWVKKAADLSAQELEIWQGACKQIQQQLAGEVIWDDLDRKMVQTNLWVAQQYDKDPFDFTVAEGLMLTEEVSRRVQQILNENLPLYEQLKVSHLVKCHSLYQQHGELAFKLAEVVNIANTVRKITSPWLLALDVVKTKVTGELFEKLQKIVQRVILEECAYLALELHSGRFKFDHQLPASSQLHEQDLLDTITLEPLRIVMVGQTCAGKSNLINCLAQQVLSEVHPLPSTPQKQVYEAQIAEQAVHFIDLKGLDGQADTEQKMLNEMLQADVILWVLKANQPARSLDTQLYQKFIAHFADKNNIQQKQAQIIGVLNQVDLLNPVHEWQPPLNLDAPTTAKEQTTVAALAYNQGLLSQIEHWQATSIASDKAHFGVEQLAACFLTCVEEAKATQLNRRRFEAREGKGVKEQLSRTKQLVTNSVKRAMK